LTEQINLSFPLCADALLFSSHSGSPIGLEFLKRSQT
jgi:hypothetical protein